MATRLFLVGVLTLFFGVQLRAVDTWVLNERVSQIVNKRIAQKVVADKKADTFAASLYDPYFDIQEKAITAVQPNLRSISPPRWLGYSLLSVGAVLVLTCPVLRR